jgi:ABC-type transporter Mla subunit MlaD
MIKSQQDVINETKSKKKMITEKLKNKMPVETSPPTEKSPKISDEVRGASDILDILNNRVDTIEKYLEMVSPIIKELEITPDHIKTIAGVVEELNTNLTTLTNSVYGLADLEDNRYNEVAAIINDLHDTVTKLDQAIPLYVDKKITEAIESPKVKISGEETP